MIAEPTDYRTERAIFLDRLSRAGASVDHHEHPLPGLDGEPVFTDVGRLGAAVGEARSIVIVSSGTHGVEGHAGSALQSLLLERGEFADLPDGVAVLLVHAINPWGMSWERRVDADNIDVNRNFVDFEQSLPENEGYWALDGAMNDVTDPDDAAWVAEIMGFAEQQGWPAMFRAITGGQYAKPDGMQFGGSEASWSRRTLSTIWERHLAAADSVYHLDVHTGLGPNGVLTIFQTADEDEAAAAEAKKCFPTVYRSDRTTSAGAVQSGVLGPGLDAALGDDVLVVPVVVEFGTFEAMDVFGAMRADNWLHNRSDPAGADGERVRARMRKMFAPHDPDWRTIVDELGTEAVRSALAGAADQSVN